jgi:hypothetical protein
VCRESSSDEEEEKFKGEFKLIRNGPPNQKGRNLFVHKCNHTWGCKCKDVAKAMGPMTQRHDDTLEDILEDQKGAFKSKNGKAAGKDGLVDDIFQVASRSEVARWSLESALGTACGYGVMPRYSKLRGWSVCPNLARRGGPTTSAGSLMCSVFSRESVALWHAKCRNEISLRMRSNVDSRQRRVACTRS